MIYDFFDSLLISAQVSIFAVHQKITAMYKPYDEEPLHCLECGEPIAGRTDKKFCNSGCRNAWHEHIRSRNRQQRHSTLKILSSNYAILENLLRLKRSSCPVGSLIEMGFDPEIVTHKGEKKGRHLVYRCFDLAYSLTPGKLFNLHRL